MLRGCCNGGGEGRPQSFDSFWDALVGKDNVYGDTVDPSNQIAGFDARLNLQPLLSVPVSVYGQFTGEDEAGGLPIRKMYLSGVDFSSEFNQRPYQLYAEWVDTRTNGKTWGYTYNHRTYTDGYYQHGFPLGHAIGGDGQMVSAGGSVTINSANRVNGRVLFAKLTGSERGAKNNLAFPEKDEVNALDLTWTHQLRTDIPVKLNGWLSDSDRRGTDAGVSLGIEFPLN